MLWVPAAAVGNRPVTASPPARKSSSSAAGTSVPVAADVSNVAVVVPSASRVTTVTPVTEGMVSGVIS